MQIKEIIKSSSQGKYEVSVSNVELNTIRAGLLENLAPTVNIPGFRQGKVPLDMVENKYKSKLTSDALEKAVNDGIKQVVEDNKLQPIGQPKINVKEYVDGGALIFEAEFTILPVVDEPDYSKITLDKVTIELSDTEVEKSLEELAKNYNSYEDIKTKRATKKDDVVVINFVGKADGVEFSGGKGENYPLKLGSNTFIPGFEEQLIGKNIGDKVEVNVTFPENYHSKDLANKKAVFDVELVKLQKAIPATIDDELAKKTGFQTLDQLKENIKKEHTQQLNDLQKNKLKQDLIDHLFKECKVEVPENILEDQLNNMWNDFLKQKEHMKSHENNNDHQDHGHTQDEIDYYNKPDDEIKKDHKEKAEKAIATSLIFNSVVTNNKLSLSNEDVMSEAQKEATMYGIDVNTFLERYKDNQQLLQQLQGRAMENKIVDFILDKVSFKETKVSFEEYLKQLSVPSSK